AVTCRGRVDDWRVESHVIDLIPVQPVEEYAEPSAQGRLAVAEYVEREAEARSKGERRSAIRIPRNAVLAGYDKAIRGVAAARNEEADVRNRAGSAGAGI